MPIVGQILNVTNGGVSLEIRDVREPLRAIDLGEPRPLVADNRADVTCNHAASALAAR
jgi:hypothetical protein